MGHTEVVIEEEEVGDIEEIVEMCDEWQDGVFSAERPADRAICRRGTEGSARSELCVSMNKLARVFHRAWLYSSYTDILAQPNGGRCHYLRYKASPVFQVGRLGDHMLVGLGLGRYL